MPIAAIIIIMSSDSEPDEVPDKNGDDDGSGMSAYERQRQENIARNQAVLASLGLAGGSGLIRPSASSVSDRPPRQPRQPREKVVYERREMPRRERTSTRRFEMTALGGDAAASGRASLFARGRRASFGHDGRLTHASAPNGAFNSRGAGRANAMQQSQLGEYIPPCPECDGPGERIKGEMRRFACQDPICGHEVRTDRAY